MAWRLGQTQTPRLQAGDAPSVPSGYAAPRPGPTGTAPAAGRYCGPSDPARFVYGAPLRRSAGLRGTEQGEKGKGEGAGLEGRRQMEVTGYMSDGDILGSKGRTDDVTSG